MPVDSWTLHNHLSSSTSCHLSCSARYYCSATISMSLWKRLRDAAFGSSRDSPCLAEEESNASITAPCGAPSTDPPPMSQEHHYQAVSESHLILSEDDSNSASLATASVIDITSGARENAISLVDCSDSDPSDEANKARSLTQPRSIPPPPELNSNGFRIYHRTEQKAIEAMDEFA